MRGPTHRRRAFVKGGDCPSRQGGGHSLREGEDCSLREGRDHLSREGRLFVKGSTRTIH